MDYCQCPCNESLSSVGYGNGGSVNNLIPPFSISTSALEVSVKEICILAMFFLLLMYAVITFLTQWNKNYRDINHLPYYQIYIEETPRRLSGLIKL